MHVMNGDDVDIRCHADLVIFSVVQESTSVLPDSDSPDSWKEQVPRRITCRLLWKYSDDRGLGPVFILYNGQDGEVILTVCLEEVDYVIKEKKWHEICTTDGQHLELHFNSDDQHFPEFFHLLTEVLTKIQPKKERLTESLKKEFVRGATRDTSLQSVSLAAAPENSEPVQSLYANLDDIQQLSLTRVTDLPGTQYNRTEQSNHGNLLNSKPELPPRPKQRLLSATPRHPVPTPRLKSKYNTSFSDTGISYNQLQEDTTDETIMKPGAGVNTAAKSAVTSTPAEQVRLSVGELSSLAESLQIAIQHGDILQAQEAAERLARLRAQLLITLKASAPTLDPNEQDIRVTVHVEDKETSGGRVTLKLKPSMTIRELKKKMLFTYGFPPDVQRWIIGKRLVKDTDTLARCGVKANGDPVFLYLVSAQSVGLQPGTTFVEDEHGYITPVLVPAQTATDVNMSNGYVSMNGGYITLGPPGSHSSRDPVNRPICPQPPPVEPEHPSELRLASTPQQAAADRTAVATELPIVAEREQASLQGLPVVVSATVPAPAPEHEEPPEPEPVEQVGWACQVCTYINVPTRPGCQMCSTDRPRDYKVPDNYHMPEEERKRLEREAELEQLARQTAEVLAGRDEAGHVGGVEMSEDDFDLLLRLNDAFHDWRQTQEDRGQTAEHVQNDRQVDELIHQLRIREQEQGWRLTDVAQPPRDFVVGDEPDGQTQNDSVVGDDEPGALRHTPAVLRASGNSLYDAPRGVRVASEVGDVILSDDENSDLEGSTYA